MYQSVPRWNWGLLTLLVLLEPGFKADLGNAEGLNGRLYQRLVSFVEVHDLFLQLVLHLIQDSQIISHFLGRLILNFFDAERIARAWREWRRPFFVLYDVVVESLVKGLLGRIILLCSSPLQLAQLL